MQDYLSLLEEFVAHRSISTDSTFRGDVEQTAAWLQDLFARHGVTARLLDGYGHPIVFAQAETNPDLPTCLVYGHYDVQPARRSDGWRSDPFVLTEHEDRLVGRGVVDNKGQILIHVWTALTLLGSKELRWNVQFLIEGDEETGAGNVGQALRDLPETDEVDAILISDGDMHYRPVVTASLRGAFNWGLRVKTASNDVHSGLYGGVVPNAAEELLRVLDTLTSAEYELAIPGLSAAAARPSQGEMENAW